MIPVLGAQPSRNEPMKGAAIVTSHWWRLPESLQRVIAT